MRSQYALIGLSLGRPIYVSTLLFIDLDLQFGKFFPEPFLHRRHQPVMSLVGIDQDYQIIGKPCVLDVGRSPARSLPPKYIMWSMLSAVSTHETDWVG
jgi:hypothetical protein